MDGKGAIIIWCVIIMAQNWFELFSKLQGGGVNDMLLLCVFPPISCDNIWSLQNIVVWITMEGDKRKGKWLSAHSDTDE